MKKIKVNTEFKPFDIQSKNEPVNLQPETSSEVERNNSNNDHFPDEDKREEFRGDNEFLKKFEDKHSAEIVSDRSAKSLSSLIGNIFDEATAWAIYLLVFLTPIFVLPLSIEIYEFNKTLILFLFSGLAFLFWSAKMILVDRKITIVKTPLNYPIIIFTLIVILSTLFSVDKVSSVLGFYGRYSDSLIVYLSLVMFYFVVVNYAVGREKNSDSYLENTQRFINNLVKAFLISSSVAITLSIFYSIGIELIPWQETKFRSFNLVGESLNILGIYIIPVILMALYYKNISANTLTKNLMSILIVMSLIALILVDFILPWIILAISSVVIIIFTIINKIKLRSLVEKEEKLVSASGSFFVPFLILVISLVFVASSLTFFNDNKQPNFVSSVISSSARNRLVPPADNRTNADLFIREIVLDKETAGKIATEGLKKDAVAGIIGSGPGTYLYNFAKFKPVEFNENAFWAVRFDKAGSEILEKVSTIGILGTLSYLLIVFILILSLIKSLAKKENVFQNASMAYLFAAWLGLLLAQFMYLESTSLKLVFWMLTAVIMFKYVLSKKDRGVFTLELKKEDQSIHTFLTIFLLLVGFFVLCCNYQFNFFQAETNYKKAQIKQNEALAESLTEEDVWKALDQSVSDFKEVIEKNPHRGDYKVYLSDVYYTRASLATQEEGKKEEKDRDNNRIALEVKSAIDYIKDAADSNPNNVIFQQKLGDVYVAITNNLGIVGADEWAIIKYKKALELEPTNPILHMELGKVYILQYSGEEETSEKVDKAIEQFEKTMQLKDRYADAGYYLGLAYETKGDTEKAISELSAIGSIERIDNVIAAKQEVFYANSDSIDFDVAFQLGRIYYNSGEIEMAKNIFQKVVKITPKHSNAHYSLGTIYEKEGDKENAIREFEIVLQLNPDNQEIIKKIDGLKKLIGNVEDEEENESEEEDEDEDEDEEY